MNRISSNIYLPGSAGADYTFVDTTGNSRLLLGSSTNAFLYRSIMPSLLCNGAITTTSASESVEIGGSRSSGIVRISSAFATLRLEGVGASTTATGWTIQRNNASNSTSVMLGTVIYQTWANNLNIFSKDLSIPN